MAETSTACPRCQAPVPPQAAQCASCGASLPVLQQEQDHVQIRHRVFPTLDPATQQQISQQEEQIRQRPQAGELWLQLAQIYQNAGVQQLHEIYRARAQSLAATVPPQPAASPPASPPPAAPPVPPPPAAASPAPADAPPADVAPTPIVLNPIDAGPTTDEGAAAPAPSTGQPERHIVLRQRVLPTLAPEVRNTVAGIEQAIRAQPDMPSLWLQLAEVYRQAGQQELSQEYQQKEQELSAKSQTVVPSAEVLQQNFLFLREKVLPTLPPQAQQQIGELENQIRSHPESSALWLQMSQKYRELSIDSLYLACLDKALLLEPDNAAALQQKEALREKQSPAPDATPAREEPPIPVSHGLLERHGKVLTFGVAALLLALVVGVLALFMSSPTECLAKGEGDLDTWMPRWSGDGKSIAYLQAPKTTLLGFVEELEGQVKGETQLVVKKLDGEPRKVASLGKGNIGSLTFSWRPGSNEITYVSYKNSDGSFGANIRNLTVADGTSTVLTKGDAFAWSHDGQYLAFIRSDWEADIDDGLYVLDTRTDEEELVSSLHCSAPSWSPQKHVLLFQAFDMEAKMDSWRQGKQGDRDPYLGDIFTYDTEDVEQLTESGLFLSPVFTPDGNKILAISFADSGSTNTLVVLNKDGSDPQTLLSRGKEYRWFSDFSVSADGKKLAFEGVWLDGDAPDPPAGRGLEMLLGDSQEHKKRSDIFTVDMDGKNLARLKTKHPNKYKPRYSPTQDTIAYEVATYDGRTEIWSYEME